METKIYDTSTIDEAAELLKAGQLIAFPTETVYGLGAIASNDEAVKNVYKVKGRPSDNPLIVHVFGSGDCSVCSLCAATGRRLDGGFLAGSVDFDFSR